MHLCDDENVSWCCGSALKRWNKEKDIYVSQETRPNPKKQYWLPQNPSFPPAPGSSLRAPCALRGSRRPDPSREEAEPAWGRADADAPAGWHRPAQPGPRPGARSPARGAPAQSRSLTSELAGLCVCRRLSGKLYPATREVWKVCSLARSCTRDLTTGWALQLVSVSVT